MRSWPKVWDFTLFSIENFSCASFESIDKTRIQMSEERIEFIMKNLKVKSWGISLKQNCTNNCETKLP